MIEQRHPTRDSLQVALKFAIKEPVHALTSLEALADILRGLDRVQRDRENLGYWDFRYYEI